MRMPQYYLRVLATLCIVIGILNICAFSIAWARAGGSALSDSCTAHACYVNDRGTRTPVTPAVWKAIQRHELSLFLTHPLAMLGMSILVRDSMRRYATRGNPIRMDASVRDIQNSGARLKTLRCAGSTGLISTNRLRIDMYPAGLVCSLPLRIRLSLRYTDIIAIRREQAWHGEGVAVIHTSSLLASPLRLRCADARALSETLERVTGIAAEP